MPEAIATKRSVPHSWSGPGERGVRVEPSSVRRDCPVCGIETEQRWLFEKCGYAVLSCLQCKLGRTDVPTGFDIGAIYTEAYFQGETPDGYCDYRASEAILRREFRRTLGHLRRVVSGGRLLEIGCAYGFFLDEARRYFQCRGVEISQSAAAACRQRGLDVSQGTIESAGLDARAAFDAMVMLDVIEHLPDPAETVASLARQMSSGGALLITTGDWGSPLARLLGRRWRLMTPPQHLFFFSRRTLTRLLERLGFTVVRCVRPWKFVPFGLAAYQVGSRCGCRFRRLEQLSDIGVPVNLFDAVQIIARKGP